LRSADQEIAGTFPELAEYSSCDAVRLVNPKRATLEQARQALLSGEALLATDVSDDATFVWAVPQHGGPA